MTIENTKTLFPDYSSIPIAEERPGGQLQDEFHADSSLLYDFWAMLRRRRYWVLALLTISTIAAVVLGKLKAPEFDSSSEIRILESNGADLQLGSAPASQLLGGNSETKIQTEMSVLKSKTLALRVADVLNLYGNSMFSKPGKTEGLPSSSNPVSVFRILEQMRKAVTVTDIPHTEAISIRVRTRSPQLSEQIANTLVDQYVERGYQVRFKSQEGISEWLAKQLDDLRRQTEQAQTRALEYGKNLDLLNTSFISSSMNGTGGGSQGQESLATQRLLGLQQSLTAAESERLVKEAQYKVLNTSDVTAVPQQSDPVLTGLLTARSNALSQLQQYGLKFGPNYSHIQELKTQIDQLNQQINSELANDRKQAFSELTAASQAQQSLQDAVNGEKSKMQQHQSDLIAYTIAQRDFESSYALYQGLLQKLKEAGVLAGLRANDVEIIDRALIPIVKSAPLVSIYLLGGVGIGAVLGIMVAFLIDALDTSILDSDLLEKATGVPSVGLIPKVKTAQGATLSTAHWEKGGDSDSRRLVESYWALRTSLLLSHAGEPPRTIAITSAIPAEGKTTTAINLALVLAQNEDRVLLIECDLRLPTFAARLGLGEAAGLSHYLAGMKPLDECIRPLPGQNNLDIMTAGLTPPSPAKLLGSMQFHNLIIQMRSIYKFVIIDSPPVASISDVQIIAREVDGVLLVVRSGSTSRHLVHRSCRMLRQTGARLLGSVLNGVDYRSDNYGYYGYYSYYSAKPGGSGPMDGDHDESE